MSLEADWMIPQPDWITFPQTLDSFGFLLGTSKPIGVGKYSQFQEILLTLPPGIYCLQETKSTHSGVLKVSHVHFYLSGTTDDPHAGVGFAIPTPLLLVLILNTILTALHFLLYMLPPQFKIKDLITKENINFGNALTQFWIIVNRTSSQS